MPLRRSRRAAHQALLQPKQDADELDLGTRLTGRDGKQYEVVYGEDEFSHRWAPVRKMGGTGKGGAGGTKRRRCGTCAGCLADNCGACGNCLDMPKFGGPGVKKQACRDRLCRQLSIQPRSAITTFELNSKVAFSSRWLNVWSP